MNVSKETTVGEIIKIGGIDDFHGRMQGLNLCGGQTNSLEFMQTVFKMPKLEDWLDIYDKCVAQEQ